MEMKTMKRSPLEMVVLLIVFVSLLAFMVNSYVLERRVFKEKALLYELTLLRQGVDLYVLMEKKKPANLLDLAVATYTLPNEQVKQRYLERVHVNDKGQVIDPFGMPYTYDATGGWVASATPGYLNW